MKKLIALAIVAVMLVAMAANVLANETVYATAVKVSDTDIFDGKATEYGDPVAYVSSEFAYDDDSVDEEIPGCNAYMYYQGVDPYFMDMKIYIAWAYENCDRMYYAFDIANVDGKFVGLATEEPWACESIQIRMTTDPAKTDRTLENGEIWGDETYNIIMAGYTKNMNPQYVTNGYIFSTLANDNTVSITDHFPSGAGWLNRDEGVAAGSIGVWDNRITFEFVLMTKWWLANPTLYAGEKFAASACLFNSEEGLANWSGCLTWGHGIVWMNNGYGKTGSNEVILAEYKAPSVVTTESTNPGEATGDALVVVVATAIMALGTAMIVKKVK